jgi:hypothetical protein
MCTFEYSTHDHVVRSYLHDGCDRGAYFFSKVDDELVEVGVIA